MDSPPHLPQGSGDRDTLQDISGIPGMVPPRRAGREEAGFPGGGGGQGPKARGGPSESSGGASLQAQRDAVLDIFQEHASVASEANSDAVSDAVSFEYDPPYVD